MTAQSARANTRSAQKLISDLALVHDIEIKGFLRDKNNKDVLGVVIYFIPPIMESDLG